MSLEVNHKTKTAREILANGIIRHVAYMQAKFNDARGMYKSVRVLG